MGKKGWVSGFWVWVGGEGGGGGGLGIDDGGEELKREHCAFYGPFG